MTGKEIDEKFFPTGFTGFSRTRDFAFPSVEPADFKAVIYVAARVLGGRVVEIQNAGGTPNFHSALMEWSPESKQVVLRCNRIHPIVAFCRPGDSFLPEYIDSPELAAAIAKVSSWQIISKSALDSIVDSNVLELMSPQDRHIVEEAKRCRWFGDNRTVGDIIFHHWD